MQKMRSFNHFGTYLHTSSSNNEDLVSVEVVELTTIGWVASFFVVIIFALLLTTSLQYYFFLITMLLSVVIILQFVLPPDTFHSYFESKSSRIFGGAGVRKIYSPLGG